MKHLIYILIMQIFISCGNDYSGETIAETEPEAKIRSIGFHTYLPNLQWHLGTEDAVEIVMKFDSFWADKNYDAMMPLMVDTVLFSFADGRTAASPAEFIAILEADENSDTWTFNTAYSVDLNPELGGEHVQAIFTSFSIEAGDTTRTYYHESYYIIQGKIIFWDQFSRKQSEE